MLPLARTSCTNSTRLAASKMRNSTSPGHHEWAQPMRCRVIDVILLVRSTQDNGAIIVFAQFIYYFPAQQLHDKGNWV